MRIITILILFLFSFATLAQEIPKNAHKNIYANGWSCDKGFKKSDNQCLAVQIPKNAQLSYLGNSWECKKGYRRSGNQCLAVQIPKNAQLSY
ncbi:hypothetical protein, partial [Sulfurovum sp.]|uniref:hypothetical protein n=1 Tax=Sulfurovum sp. TaxID=1969726 RepID=UPI0035621604